MTQNHKPALLLAQTVNNNDEIFLSPYTIPETITVLCHRVSQKKAIEVLINLRNESYTILPLSKEATKLSDKYFLKQKKNHTSWPDCLNMALAKLNHIDYIFSFDEVYKQNGFRVLKNSK